MISNLVKLFKQKITENNKQPFTIHETEIPFDIKQISKLYPILHTVAGNRAVGEVRKFEFVKPNTLRKGQAIIINEKFSIVSTWIHLGNDFFKLVMKA